MVLLVSPDSTVSLAISHVPCTTEPATILFSFLRKQLSNLTLLNKPFFKRLYVSHRLPVSLVVRKIMKNSLRLLFTFFPPKTRFTYIPNLFSSFSKESLRLCPWILNLSHQRVLANQVSGRGRAGGLERGGGRKGNKSPEVQSFGVPLCKYSSWRNSKGQHDVTRLEVGKRWTPSTLSRWSGPTPAHHLLFFSGKRAKRLNLQILEPHRIDFNTALALWLLSK